MGAVPLYDCVLARIAEERKYVCVCERERERERERVSERRSLIPTWPPWIPPPGSLCRSRTSELSRRRQSQPGTWLSAYRGTSLIRKDRPLGPYRRPMPRVLGGSSGVGGFLMSEVLLH